MVKKILFTFFITLTLTAFAQHENSNVSPTDTELIIKDVVASPNPFSVTTKIKFYADDVYKVEFSVKDLIGNTVHYQKYTTKKGSNFIPFYRDKLDSGVYIYSLKSGSTIISKRIVIK